MKKEFMHFKKDKGSMWGIIVGGNGRREGINEIILSFQTFFLKKLKKWVSKPTRRYTSGKAYAFINEGRW